MPEASINQLPKDKLTWEYLAEMKKQLPSLYPDWVKPQEFERARALEILIMQLTNYLINQNQ